MKAWHFENPYIVLNDIENTQNISHVFGKHSELHSKVSTILVNLYEIGLVYEEDGQYILTTSEKDFTIKESPEEVFNLIREKVIFPEQADNKQFKHQL